MRAPAFTLRGLIGYLHIGVDFLHEFVRVKMIQHFAHRVGRRERPSAGWSTGRTATAEIRMLKIMKTMKIQVIHLPIRLGSFSMRLLRKG